MRIAAYNVNGINGRLANLLGWLEEATPDIVCLQELKAPDEKFSAAAIRAAGYGAIWHGQKSWYGVAILARGAEPIAVRPLDPVILPARGRHAPIEESGSHMTPRWRKQDSNPRSPLETDSERRRQTGPIARTGF
jgi:exodeoxyribonuclease-3